MIHEMMQEIAKDEKEFSKVRMALCAYEKDYVGGQFWKGFQLGIMKMASILKYGHKLEDLDRLTLVRLFGRNRSLMVFDSLTWKYSKMPPESGDTAVILKSKNANNRLKEAEEIDKEELTLNEFLFAIEFVYRIRNGDTSFKRT